MKQRNILVLDIEGRVSNQLRLLDTEDICFVYATSAPEAKQLLRNRIFSVALVVFDSSYPMQQEDVDQLISDTSLTEWIALTEAQAFESIDFQHFILRAFHDYHTLPLDGDRLLSSIGHACGKARLRVSLKEMKAECAKFEIVGTSPAMNALFARLEKIVNTDLPVLIIGETGTGKELVAQAIHKHSRRSSGPMVVVNCGAIPTHLIQSEMFGHEKGAFTGAVQRQIGKIEAANGGVLFLDEIGDLPPDMQASLLRVLQDHTISRIGSSKVIPVDFRVISATHVDLREAITLGRFREDLFYRLNVIHLDVPPLRKRGNDITLLAEVIFRKYSAEYRDICARGFSKQALRALRNHEWPGNVRELINRIQRAMVMSESRSLSPADLGLDSISRINPCLKLDDARAVFDRDILETSLQAHGNNVSQAARQLGISRVTLYRLMNKFKTPPSR